MPNANYIPYWYDKFGQEAMQKWMQMYGIEVDSFIFKFQPTHLLDKIQDAKDLFEFSEYVGGFNSSKIVSYYAALCNNFYQERNTEEIELAEDEDDDFDDVLALVWENVQDMSIAISDIKEYSQKLEEIFNLTSKIGDILTSLDSKKIERNAKYQQVEDIKKMISQMKEQLTPQKRKNRSFYFAKENLKLISIIAVSIMTGLIIGGIFL